MRQCPKLKAKAEQARKKKGERGTVGGKAVVVGGAVEDNFGWLLGPVAGVAVVDEQRVIIG